MATDTPNVGLRKPTSSDLINVTLDIADNMDAIDTAIGDLMVGSGAPSGVGGGQVPLTKWAYRASGQTVSQLDQYLDIVALGDSPSTVSVPLFIWNTDGPGDGDPKMAVKVGPGVYNVKANYAWSGWLAGDDAGVNVYIFPLYRSGLVQNDYSHNDAISAGPDEFTWVTLEENYLLVEVQLPVATPSGMPIIDITITQLLGGSQWGDHGPPRSYTFIEDDRADPASWWGEAGVKVYMEWTPTVTGPLTFYLGHDNGDPHWASQDIAMYLFEAASYPDLTAGSGSWDGEWGTDYLDIYPDLPYNRSSYEQFMVQAGVTYVLVLVDWDTTFPGHTIDLAGPLIGMAGFGGLGFLPPLPPPGTHTVPVMVDGAVLPWLYQITLDGGGVVQIGTAYGAWFGDYPTPSGGYYGVNTWARVGGTECEALGWASSAEGYGTRTTFEGHYSHAEGKFAVASGPASHAEGSGHASGHYSHAEGGFFTSPIASGMSSHAEGDGTESIASATHAEGAYTRAREQSAHSEGTWCIASAHSAHAQGYNAIAWRPSEHAESCGFKNPTPTPEVSFFQASRLTMAAEGNSVLLINGLGDGTYWPLSTVQLLKLTPSRLSILTGKVAVRDATGTKGWTFSLLASMGVTGATPAIIGTPTITVVADSGGVAAGWTLVIGTTVNGLTFTGNAAGASGLARWGALVELVEV